jgi:hypothetical protein
MVEQMSLSSTEYPKGVNEFEKAGFTAIESEKIRPFRVKESPVQFECKVTQVIELGDQGGAGNLIICEVILAHVNDAVLDASNAIDQQKIDLVARMGGNWYCRAHGEALFEIEKPLTTLGIGVDAIPHSIRYSPILSGNNLGQLGNVEHIPSDENIREFKESGEYEILLNAIAESDFASHQLAKQLLAKGDVQTAWKVLLAGI